MKAMTENDFANKLTNAGANIWRREDGYFWASKGDRHVRVLFNIADRFLDAKITDKDGRPLSGPNRTLRTMAAVERHLGI